MSEWPQTWLLRVGIHYERSLNPSARPQLSSLWWAARNWSLTLFCLFSKLFCSLGKVRWGPGGRLSVLIVSCVNFSEWCALSYTVPPNRAHSRPRLSTSTKSLYSLRLFKGSPDICFNCSQCFVIFSRNLPMGYEGEQWSKMWVISNTFVGEILLIEECFWYAFDYNLKRKKKKLGLSKPMCQ